jgi:hypothetical protein
MPPSHNRFDPLTYNSLVHTPGAQLVFVQFGNIEKSWLPSALGALTAITYSLIALGLCIAKGEAGRMGLVDGGAC